jgi:hypothetical protein
MNDVSRPPEVHNNGDGAGRESFEHYSCAVIAKGGKHKHIRTSHPTEYVLMADPTTEGDALLNPKGLRKLFEAVSLRSVTDDCEAGQIAP